MGKTNYMVMALVEAKGQQETGYLQHIEMLSLTLAEDRDTIAAFLEDHPEMEEFLSGDKENGYTYVPGKITEAPEGLLESLRPYEDKPPCTTEPHLIGTVDLSKALPMVNGDKIQVSYETRQDGSE